MAVVVVIGRNASHRPTRIPHASDNRHIGKATAVVAVELVGRMLTHGKARKGRAVGHVQIHVAIAVVIEKGSTAHHPLDYVALVGARDIGLRQAGGRRPINELHSERIAPPIGCPKEAPDRTP